MAIIGISGKIGSGKSTIGKIIQYLTDFYILKNNSQGDDLPDEPNEEDYNEFLYNDYDHLEEGDWQIKAFAGKLKQIVSILTGIPVEDLEKQEVKDMVLGEEWWYYKGRHSTLIPFSKDSSRSDEDLIKLTPRLLLQLLGTECGRNIIHPNCWVNALFADYITKKYSVGIDKYGHQTIIDKYSNWIITDVRFPNELQSIKDRGGIIIRVNRMPEWEKKERAKLQEELPEGLYEISEGLSTGKGGYIDFSILLKKEFNKKQHHESETALDDATFDYTINNNGTIEELVKEIKAILIAEGIL